MQTYMAQARLKSSKTSCMIFRDNPFTELPGRKLCGDQLEIKESINVHININLINQCSSLYEAKSNLREFRKITEQVVEKSSWSETQCGTTPFHSAIASVSTVRNDLIYFNFIITSIFTS